MIQTKLSLELVNLSLSC